MQTTNTSAKVASLNGLLLLVSLVMLLITACNFVNSPQLYSLVCHQCTSIHGIERELSPEQKRCLYMRRIQLKSGHTKFAPRNDAPFQPTFNSCIENSKLMACRLRLHISVRVIARVLMYLELICEALSASMRRLGATTKEEALKSTPVNPDKSFTEYKSMMTDLFDTVR